MPTLNWIGKDKVVTHHQEVPYRVLEHQYGFRANNPDDRSETNSGNMVIHGDNLEALKALMPQYEGRIKCIYIDPPYNTGNEKWVYNDNVNDPKIKKWLGEVVGQQGEDLSRHDKWLCMMYPRLTLLHKLLSDDGIIFISIDDNEQANLKMLCDDIFGCNNFVGTYFWKKTSTPPALSYKIRRKLEYVLCYQKEDIEKRHFVQGYVDGGDAPLLNGGNPLGRLTFPKGSVRFNISDGEYEMHPSHKIKLITKVIVKNGVNINDFEAEGHFKWVQSNLLSEIQNGTFFVVKSNQFSIRYQKATKATKVPSNIIDEDVSVGTNEDAQKELAALGLSGTFDYAKPSSLIEFLAKMPFWDDKSIIILDSFAGSGTTGHAVLNLNKKDGGNRKFILVEMEDYAERITAERVRRVMTGYGNGTKAVEGTGGEFDYYELGAPLFKDNLLNEEVEEDKMREYIYYSETKCPLTRKREDNAKYMLDTHNGTSYYFYYKKDELTTLNYESLNIVVERAEAYVIYADVCTIPEEVLAARNIVFKKIPRDIKRV